MARLQRVCPVGVPQHIIQRGNNHQPCFAGEHDFAAYANWLKVYAIKFEVDVHAWVLMTNHVHLLCTPQAKGAISDMMQGLGRQYVRYFNHRYNRTGTLWEGRYKSCVVEQEDYLLQLYRYIELNPVRADMVAHPSQYAWSSYQINALGKKSDLCTPHPLFLALGKNALEVQIAYRSLFAHLIDGRLLADIRKNTNNGMAIGSDHFKQEIEALTGRRMQPKKKGRPVSCKQPKT